MGVRLIQVPYDSGLREQRMGRGPACFVEHGAVARLSEVAGSVELDEAEAALLGQSAIRLAPCEQIRDSGASAALAPILDSWSGRVDGVHIHIDLDVHDPAFVPANPYQPAGGSSPEQVRDCVRAIAGKLPVLGATVTAYDPAADPEGKGLAVGLELIAMLGKLGQGK